MAQVDTVTGSVRFLHGDLVGSNRTATDESGGVVGAWDYAPFGVVTTATGGVADDGVGVTRFLFAGEYQDDSGLYYLRARFMDPVTASFLSVDPALSATGSPYAYAAGNPLQLTDPLGLWPGSGLFDSVKSAVSSTVDLVSSGASVTGNWIVDHKAEIIGAVVGVVVFAGCSAILGPTAGPVGIAGCGALAGAAASMTTYAIATPKDCWTAGGFFVSGAIGGVIGGVTAGAGNALAPLASKAFNAAASRATPAIRNAINRTVTALKPRSATAESTADDALAMGRTTGAASELNAGGQVFTDVSTGGAPRVLHPSVQEALDAVPTAQQAPWHGACAEMGCLSQALTTGIDPAGGSIRSVAIGASNPGHGLPKVACSSCRAVLDFFGVSS